MKILVVNQYFPPDAANSAYILGELAEDLSEAHQVTILAGRSSYNPEASTFRPQGVSIRRVNSARGSRSTILGRIVNYLSFAVLAPLRAFFMPRPDVVVSMTDPPIGAWLGALIAAKHRRPTVHICHDLHPDSAIAVGGLRNALVVRIWRALNHVAWRRTTRIIVVAREMQTRLEAEGVPAEKLTFVPTWSARQSVAAEEVQRLRSVQGWSGRFVVMHAGNMGLAQNLGYLPDVAKQLDDDPEILFVCVGDGAAKEAVMQRVTRLQLSNFAFLPYVPKAKAQLLMASADLHLVSLVPGLGGLAAPSKTYGIMAVARPFVAAVDERAEPALIANEWGCGVRVPPGDRQALAVAIREFKTADLAAMGARAAVAFESGYERRGATHKTREILEQAAAEWKAG